MLGNLSSAVPTSRIACASFDYVKKNPAVEEPAPPVVPSRPLIQRVPPDLSNDPREEIWKRKRRQFWSCGQNSIWRTPLMISWYCAAILLVGYEMWLHLGPNAEQYRHESAVEVESFYAAHGMLFPIHDLLVASGRRAGWRRPELETLSIPDISHDYATSFLDTSDATYEY